MRDRRYHYSFFLWPTCFLLVLLIAAGLASAQQTKASLSDLALVGGKVYASPTATPIDDAVVLVHDGKILAIGKRREIAIPDSDRVIDCTGKVITAGFWNSHVHFTEDAWNNAATAPANKLEQHMQEMLTRWGFTTVFDIGSNPQNTIPLRHRVEAGEIAGPKIYTTAGVIFPENGVPVYLPPELAAQVKQQEAATPADAARLAKQSLAMGADGIKLFTGAIKGHGKVIPMPVDVARAASEVAHADGKPVFAHPSNHAGTDNALAAGVNVLAHTIPMETGFTADELARMKAQHVALTPTLSLFPDEERKFGGTEEDKRVVLERAVGELKSYFDEGGTILFGTDVGYTQLYDTTSEYEYMARSGMTWRDILASLTTNPATFFRAAHTGELVKGNDANIVVLAADPASDVRNLAKVEYTIRAGKVIYKN